MENQIPKNREIQNPKMEKFSKSGKIFQFGINEIHAGRLVILLSIPKQGWQPLQVFFHTFHHFDFRLHKIILLRYGPYNIDPDHLDYMKRSISLDD